MEGNDKGAPYVAGTQATVWSYDFGAGAIYKCTRYGDDPLRLRIHFMQTRSNRDGALFIAISKAGIAPRVTTHLCDFYTPINERLEESVIVARAFEHSNNRNIYACGSVGEA